MASIVSALVSGRVERRLPALWLMGIGFNLAAWAVGSWGLPGGALRGVLPAPELIPNGGTFCEVFSRILTYNLLVAAGLIAAANLFRVGRVPLGYVPVLLHWIGYGLFLGTNSFGMPRERSTSVSVWALVTSPGFTELTAYTFVAVSTAGCVIYGQDSWLTLRATRYRDWTDIRIQPLEALLLVAAVLLLANSAWREAMQIVG
jgi:hypothetical protein